MSKRIYIPTQSPEDWRRLLAEPDKQWRTGYSARTLAECWEAADGWPPEVLEVLATSPDPDLTSVELLVAFPEYKVDLPPRGRASQNDLFVLGRTAGGQLIAITVEGKVSESFGPTLGKWGATVSSGKAARLEFITRLLGLLAELPSDIRYQLLHRTASAAILARRFNARLAIMLVHSFSPTNAWFEDYRSFVTLFGINDASPNRLYLSAKDTEKSLYFGWASGVLDRGESGLD